jgi:hypothetical protein
LLLSQHSDSLQTSSFRHVGPKLASARLVSFGRDIFVGRGGSHRQRFAWVELASERDTSCCFFTLQRSPVHPPARDLEYFRKACLRPAIEVQVGCSGKRQVLGKCQAGSISHLLRDHLLSIEVNFNLAHISALYESRMGRQSSMAGPSLWTSSALRGRHEYRVPPDRPCHLQRILARLSSSRR